LLLQITCLLLKLADEKLHLLIVKPVHLSYLSVALFDFVYLKSLCFKLSNQTRILAYLVTINHYVILFHLALLFLEHVSDEELSITHLADVSSIQISAKWIDSCLE
jgi:hypothetical protein